TVSALVAVNAVGQANVGEGPHFWAAPFEVAKEFGGLGLPSPFPADAVTPRPTRSRPAGENTTIAVVATDARLSHPQAKRLAVMAHGGLARAHWPAHSPIDGGLTDALASGHLELADPVADRIEIGAAGGACMSRAI